MHALLPDQKSQKVANGQLLAKSEKQADFVKFQTFRDFFEIHYVQKNAV